MKLKIIAGNIKSSFNHRKHIDKSKEIKYLDVGPQAQLPPPYAEDISALLTMVLS